MSMISAQIDELRKLACKLESYDQGYGTICQVLRDAADTIWELRDDLQRANDALRDAEHDESRAWDRVRKAEAENAKLKEERDGFEAFGKLKEAQFNNVLGSVKMLKSENAKLRELLGDALKTLFYKRLDGSVGCTENCPRWQFGKDCQLVDGCWLEFEAAKLGIEVEV